MIKCRMMYEHIESSKKVSEEELRSASDYFHKVIKTA